MSTMHPDRDRTLPPPRVIDPLLADRLARLDNRRSATPTPPAGPPLAHTTQRSTAKRRHPARGSRAAALVMSIGSTAGMTAYFYQADSSAASGTGATTTATALQPSVVVIPPTTPVVVASATNAFADGTFIGQTFTNRWGPVQVQATISGGQITDVSALQTPGGHGRSIQINNVAAPMLRTEALAAQSAEIHTVSGATYTSKGYRQSLQSALDVAKAQATAHA